MEILKNISQTGLMHANKVKEHFEKIKILIGYCDDYRVPSEEDFKRVVAERFDELEPLLKKIPFTFKHAKSALLSVINEEPPNSPKNQQFKDSAILELAQSHTVHFITEDKGFFLERNPEKGLADVLKAECAANSYEVIAYGDLNSYLTTLQSQVPSFDYDALENQIEKNIKQDLFDWSIEKNFLFGELKNASTSAFITEDKDKLAVSFEYQYSATDFTEVLIKPPYTDTLVVIGSGFYNLLAKSIENVALDGITS